MEIAIDIAGNIPGINRALSDLSARKLKRQQSGIAQIALDSGLNGLSYKNTSTVTD